MPRPKTEKRDQQVYKLDDGATVTIDFIVGKRPRFYQPADGVVIIGDHRCHVPASVIESYPEPVDGPTLDEINEFKRRREAPAVRKPYTSEDAARDAGFPAEALSFESLSGIAAQLPAVEESLVE